jgi:hypothetical protein
MTNDPFGETTTTIVNRIAAGDRMALDEFVQRYNWKMVRMADRYMRRLRTHLVTCDAEDAVNDTLAKLYRRATDGELPCVESSTQFWKTSFSMLKVEIRGALDLSRSAPMATSPRSKIRMARPPITAIQPLQITWPQPKPIPTVAPRRPITTASASSLARRSSVVPARRTLTPRSATASWPPATAARFPLHTREASPTPTAARLR